jgi:glucan 1,3-beta-glucosidase
LANAKPDQYSTAYKQFLKMFAEAQMQSFERAWGWFYWTWETETATQWSWKLGREAGILPQKAYAPDFKCGSAVPSFSDLGESYR